MALIEAETGETETALFDKSMYDREDLQIAKIDGQSIDRIRVKFAGEVMLDRSEPSDVAVFNALRLGKDVMLTVEAKCSGTGAKGATDRDGDLDVVVGEKSLKVHAKNKRLLRAEARGFARALRSLEEVGVLNDETVADARWPGRKAAA